MVLALGEIKNMKDPLGKLMGLEIPIRTAWKVNRLVKALDKELTEVEEFRVNLIKKYGTEDKDGGVSVEQDNMPKFVAEFNALLNTEVEVDYEPMEIDVFGDIAITSTDMMALEKLFI